MAEGDARRTEKGARRARSDAGGPRPQRVELIPGLDVGESQGRGAAGGGAYSHIMHLSPRLYR